MWLHPDAVTEVANSEMICGLMRRVMKGPLTHRQTDLRLIAVSICYVSILGHGPAKCGLVRHEMLHSWRLQMAHYQPNPMEICEAS